MRALSPMCELGVSVIVSGSGVGESGSNMRHLTSKDLVNHRCTGPCSYGHRSRSALSDGTIVFLLGGSAPANVSVQFAEVQT